MIELLDFSLDKDKYDFPDIYFTPHYHKIWENNTDDGIAKIIVFKDENLG